MNEEFEAWRVMMEADGLLVSTDGQVRFSRARYDDLRSLFGLAGIDIATIRTMEQYLRARDASRPFFGQWLSHVARDGRMTDERRLLIAIAEGDEEGSKRLREQLAGAATRRGERKRDDE